MKKLFFGLVILLTIPCIFAFTSDAKNLQNQQDYNIVIIDNGEEVPLASEMKGQPVISSAIAPFLFLAVVILLISSSYIIQCLKYRERIRLLFQKDSRTKKLGTIVNWNLFHLKDLESELENYIASSIRID